MDNKTYHKIIINLNRNIMYTNKTKRRKNNRHSLLDPLVHGLSTKRFVNKHTSSYHIKNIFGNIKSIYGYYVIRRLNISRTDILIHV